MPDPILEQDRDLNWGDIKSIENASELLRFFADLGYRAETDERALDASARALLGLGDEAFQHNIIRMYRVGSDPHDQTLIIYALEMRSMAANIKARVARAIQGNRTTDHLLIFIQKHAYEQFDFVLVDKIRREGGGGTIGYTVTPRSLELNRAGGENTVALRALRRFSYTTTDADYQWEKIKAAYNLLEWSEPEFNNRALFSDYYLKFRLTDPERNAVWEDDSVSNVFGKVRNLVAPARDSLSAEREEATRHKLIEPIFEALEFNAQYKGRIKATEGRTPEPDYILSDPAIPDQALAWALTYKWNRNLDADDHSRQEKVRDIDTTDQNPGAFIVSLLEHPDAPPWVILTNGKLWRLYSASASNKITNYYEIDLEETIYFPHDNDRSVFKYWWLIFRRAAFSNNLLEKIRTESQDYAAQIGKDLKERIFEKIFGYFAAGFVVDLRKHGLTDDQIDRPAVFNATLTFLYRLMFVLYAESRELLPLKGSSYAEKSLDSIKKEIAEAAKKVESERNPNLKEYYDDDDSFVLYQRLQTLFNAVDTGNPALGVPLYNGGLFNTDTADGQFLSTYAIPDVYLALGLDRLARDIDDKNKNNETNTYSLVFIDFKSLGVRELGSIYEGLLEFKLRIALEPMVRIEEKGRDIYMTEVQAKKEKKKPNQRFDTGRVYLEPTRQDRKSSGSYYTPDYIVKYIVEHTVGPVLKDKLEALRLRLREAQKRYYDHKKNVDIINQRHKDAYEDPEKFWNSTEMQTLADDCLNIRVLDPAMGSGHFLVEVVDFVSKRMIAFLNQFPDNPVRGMLTQTRRDILTEMQNQGVAVDGAKLTDVVLLKRSVLKRCVYGVDLNPMAVELAKVSLWLDAFTLGAPLSFLDHHLKCGNSLIGARLDDVYQGQLPLFAQKLVKRIDTLRGGMQQIGSLPDNTVEQTRKSKNLYAEIYQQTDPLRRLLDVHTSRWFGNGARTGRGKKKTDLATQFLHDDRIEVWLETPEPAKLPHDTLIDWKQVAQTATQTAREYRFFHWELEFPEVFFSVDIAEEKDTVGFDAVVGNPPYGDISDKFQKEYLDVNQPAKTGGRAEIYADFVMRGLTVVHTASELGFIVPNTLIDGAQFADLRTYLSKVSKITHLRDFRNKKVFAEAETLTMVIKLAKGKFASNYQLTTSVWEDRIQGFVDEQMEIPVASGNPWRISNQISEKVFKQDTFLTLEPELGICRDAGLDYKWKDIGWQNRGMNPKLSDILLYRAPKPKNKRDLRILKGEDIDRYSLEFNDNYLIHNWADYKTKESAVLVYLEHAQVPVKILSRQTADRIQAVIDRGQFSTAKSIHTTIITDKNYSPEYVVSVLNSQLITYIYQLQTGETGRTFAQVKLYDLRPLPIHKINFTTPTERRGQLTAEGRTRYAKGEYLAIYNASLERLKKGESDVIHDVLTFLAEQMIDLNKKKQIAVREFIGWLEDSLKIKPQDGEQGIQSLNGKTRLLNYLGDYHKRETEVDYASYEAILFKNKGRFDAVWDQALKDAISAKYEKSLVALRPIKEQLKATDALIDQIIYALYGLDEAEIRLIEYPVLAEFAGKAREQALADKEIASDNEAVVEKIAEIVTPAAEAYLARVPEQELKDALRADLPSWAQLSEKVRLFLETADLLLQRNSIPEYSSVVVQYAKAAETFLNEALFLPFRAAGHTDLDSKNEFFQKFLRGGKPVTLGSMGIFLASSDEVAFRAFIRKQYAHADTLILAKDKLLDLLEKSKVDARNGAAHDGILVEQDAKDARDWALNIVRYVMGV